ncbi:hypothetical protein N7451_012260 [Penicillium sp. IBT 35674x]|nr:hypothetical protein N7451_012260 [Penicillium sp. IBT 35674x]
MPFRRLTAHCIFLFPPCSGFTLLVAHKAVLSVVFYLPVIIFPLRSDALKSFVLLIDFVLSYLWLTAFIFATQDYNWHACFFFFLRAARNHLTRHLSFLHCMLKVLFISFADRRRAYSLLPSIFAFFGLLLEVAVLWANHKKSTNPP